MRKEKKKQEFPQYCNECKKSVFPALFSNHCKENGCGDTK